MTTIPPRHTTFALVDCVSFYTSCERAFRPDLWSVPVAVLSNNDGCIIARSEEVKRLGIPMGEPYFKCKEKLASAGTRVFSSNYTLYGDMSRRVMDVLAGLARDIEVYSIDEAFLELPLLSHKDQIDLGEYIRRQVWKCTGIPVRVGFGPTKTLSKISQTLAKQDGVSVFITEAGRDDLLRRVPVGDVWGVGRQYRRKLEEIGVVNALQLRDLHPAWAKKHMTVVGLRTVLELRGISCMPIDHVEPEHKSIIRSRMFGRKITELEDLEEAIASYASRASEKLRRYGLAAHLVQVWITTGGFGPGPHYSNTSAAPLPEATDYTPQIIMNALACLRRIYREGYVYVKAGVTLLELTEADKVQTNLFVPHNPKHAALMATMDSVNRKMGAGSVYIAKAGPDLKQSWAMKRNMMSPRYTTQLSEVAVAKAKKALDHHRVICSPGSGPSMGA